MKTARIALQFTSDIPEKTQKQIRHAFMNFCAFYGLDGKIHGEADHTLVYGSKDCPHFPYDLARATPHIQFFPYADQTRFPFAHRTQLSEPVNHLAEAFSWLSGAFEKMEPARWDETGRIAFPATPLAQHKVDLDFPYVTALFRDLYHHLTGENRVPHSPVQNTEHILIPSHDIDYYFTSRKASFKRLIRSMAAALLKRRDVRYFLELLSILPTTPLRHVGDYIPDLLRRQSASGYSATYFWIAQNHHSRDSNYKLPLLQKHLHAVTQQGGEVALHGSYLSVIEKKNLSQEKAELSRLANVPCLGGRQHWMRFADADDFFLQVEKAGFHYDSTLGFSHQSGYRHGASFPFVPWLEKESRGANFIEFPLILMDVNLKNHPKGAQECISNVVQSSRKLGWGGGSILWHNPIEPLSVDRSINRLFWNLSKTRKDRQESWMTAKDLHAAIRPRYEHAGFQLIEYS